MKHAANRCKNDNKAEIMAGVEKETHHNPPKSTKKAYQRNRRRLSPARVGSQRGAELAQNRKSKRAQLARGGAGVATGRPSLSRAIPA